jgi:hypothetical protein
MEYTEYERLAQRIDLIDYSKIAIFGRPHNTSGFTV